MLRVVLDTNVFLSGIAHPASVPGKILAAWGHASIDVVMSCNDVIEIMRHKLPRKIETDAGLVASIEDRHRRRQIAKDFVYRKQADTFHRYLSASDCTGI